MLSDVYAVTENVADKKYMERKFENGKCKKNDRDRKLFLWAYFPINLNE